MFRVRLWFGPQRQPSLLNRVFGLPCLTARRRRGAAHGIGAAPAGSGGRLFQDDGEGALRAGRRSGVVLGQAGKRPSLCTRAALVRQGAVGHAVRVPRGGLRCRRSRACSAAGFDVPVVADQGRRLLGPGAVERGEAVGHFPFALIGLRIPSVRCRTGLSAVMELAQPFHFAPERSTVVQRRRSSTPLASFSAHAKRSPSYGYTRCSGQPKPSVEQVRDSLCWQLCVSPRNSATLRSVASPSEGA